MIKGINLEEIDNTFNFKDNKHYLYFCKFKFCRDFYVFLVWTSQKSYVVNCYYSYGNGWASWQREITWSKSYN